MGGSGVVFQLAYDIEGGSIPGVPLVKGGLVFLYNTGKPPVPATPAQIAAARAAGMGVALIDQWPGDLYFAQGFSDILDVESGAATTQDAINGVLARQAHGWQSTIYISQNALPALDSALRAAGCDMSLVWYGVANYSLSLSQAESLLMENPRWAYVQWGDPVYNPDTLIPLTNVTLKQGNADIEVCRTEWSDQFMPTPPPLPPYPNPTSLTVTQFRQIQLAWKPVGSPGYMYEVQDATGKAVIPATDVDEAAVNIELPVGGTYRFGAVAHISPTNEWSDWVWSAFFTVT